MTGPRAALDGWQRIVGTPAQVRDRVAVAAATGRYDDITQPQYVPGRRGQIEVYLRLRAPAPAGPPRRRWLILAATGAVGLAATATITVVAAVWIVGHWQQLVGAGLIALAIVVAVQRARR